MQAVMNNTAGTGAASRIHFAGGRDYMMRSEKRNGIRPPSSGNSGKKPPRRRRRRRAGFFYKLLMVLLLLVLWPVGLLMLWQRKVRWGAGTKLLTSVVTLVASIILIGFLLTVNTGNAQYSAMQNSVNDFLDEAADSLVIVWEEVETQSMIVSHGVKNLSAFANIPFGDALYHATISPAKMLGVFDSVGSLEVGKFANMLVLDKELNVHEVIFKGEKI